MPDEISLVRLLNELVRTPLTDLDKAVSQAIGRLCTHVGAGWGSLFRLDGAYLITTHSYVAPGLPSLSCPPAYMLGAGRVVLEQNEPLLIADLAVLPADSPLRAQVWAKSLLALPINGETGLIGVLAFAFPETQQDLDPVLVDWMKAAAEVLETVIARREVERMHLNTARRLEATLAALPDLLFEVTADGHFAEFSAGPPQLMTAPRGNLRGRHFGTLLPPDVTRVVQQALDTVLEKGRVEGVRYRLDLPDGPHWFEVTGALKPADGPGEQPNVIFLVRDVTADTRMRDELVQLGKIVETMSNLVCITDLDENIVWCNAAFEKQTGWALEEIRGRYLGDVVRIPGEDRSNASAVANAIRQREPYSGQTVNQDRNGNRYWIDFNVIPLHDAAGELAGFATIETVVTQLKEQEEAMAQLAESATEARERLKNAVFALPDALIILDENDCLVIANPAYFTMFPELRSFVKPGLHLGDILTKGVELGLYGPEDPSESTAEWVANRLRYFHQPSASDELKLPSGCWVHRIHTRTSDGGVVALGIDVTARRNQIEALDAANRELSAALAERDRAERHLRGIMEGADVGIWEWNMKSNTLHVGGKWADMLGRDTDAPADFEFADFLELVHPDDVAKLPISKQHGADNGTGFSQLEFRIRHDQGHYIWILSRSRVTEWGPNGEPMVMAGVHLDLSERKRLERQLQAGRAYLSDVMDTSIAALTVLNERGEITYANQEAERILRLERSLLRGLSYNDPSWKLECVSGNPLPEEELPFRQALAKGGIVRDIRFAVHMSDGQRRVLSANAVPLTQADGEQHVVVSFSDITDELASTARLEEARAKAEEMSRAKSIFLANMSHEIRTPLNGVLGMAEILQGLVKTPEKQRMISTIRQSGETLLTVLNSILDMSKIEAGKMELEVVPIVLSDLLNQIEALHRVKAEEKGLDLQVLLSAGADLPRMGDPHRLTQVLNNLLSNAIKFTESGRVRLKLSCRPGKPVTIDISDTGVGMTEQQLSRVFESFEQADGSMTRRFGGTGLGLSIVRQLVLLMGGMITMQSNPGAGTDVRVILPLAEADPSLLAPPEPEVVLDVSSLAGRKLLIADDNMTNRLVLSEMLAQTGVTLTMVENGQEAIDAWQHARTEEAPFDLLLLDITMPVLDGTRALATIRERESDLKLGPVPAVAVTANAMPHQVADYIMGGFDTHLAKPFKRKELLHALKMLLRG